MILHKQSKSPRACFILPLTAPLFDSGALETAVYVGPATVAWWTDHIDRRGGEDAMRDEDDSPPERARAQAQARSSQQQSGSGSGSGSAQPLRHMHNDTCSHWRLAYDGERVELCVNPNNGHPLLIHHPYIRLHVIDWSVATDEPTSRRRRNQNSDAAAAAADGVQDDSADETDTTATNSLSFSNALFDPDRASVAKCAPFGTSTVADRARN